MSNLTPISGSADHAVIITTGINPVELEQVHALEDKINEVLQKHDFGELDGHEFALDGSEAILYLYGPDANSLFLAIAPVLKADPITRSGTAVLRFGDALDPSATEETIALENYSQPH